MTTHDIYFHASQTMSELDDESVDLVVTSPPYPMIAMWDEIMCSQNNEISTALSENPQTAFELMHQELDKVWMECWRVMKDGAFMCINIGDATRTVNGDFMMYSNTGRIASVCEKIGFTSLPNIIWKKVTNSPNKFMGSGMLPCGAYVTLEHEYILIFRKGSKRVFKTPEEKMSRRKSSYFWEERNIWFSDIWELNGVKQKIEKSTTRERSASFPLEIPLRLINMFSQKGDVILDPFAGLSNTAVASIISGRNSVSYDIDVKLKDIVENIIDDLDIERLNMFITNRIQQHNRFIDERISAQKEVKYYNDKLKCKVMTKQETDMEFQYIDNIENVMSEHQHLKFISNYYH